MRNTIFALLIGIFCLECQNQEPTEALISSHQNSKTQYFKKEGSNFNSSFHRDSIERNYEDTFKLLFHLAETDYLPVYKFSDNIMGLRFDGYEFESGPIFEGFKFIESEESGMEFWYDNDKAKWHYKGTTLVEKTPLNDILENKKLTQLLSNIYTEEYTIICTKGTVQRTFNKVYFAQDDCYSNLIYFAFAPIDKAIYGEPLWAVVSNIFEVQPIENPELEQFCRVVFDFQSRYSDFYDKPSNTNVYSILGEHDGYYLVYRDDFRWRTGDNDAMSFPSRKLIRKENDRFQVKDIHSLDLFGIPCL